MGLVKTFVLLTMFEFVVRCYPVSRSFNLNIDSKLISKLEMPRDVDLSSSNLFRKRKADLRSHRDYSTKAYFINFKDIYSECTNELENLLFRSKYKNICMKIPSSWTHVKYTNLPIVKQPFDNYKIVIAAAPLNMKLNGGGLPMIIYEIFPEIGADNSNLENIPPIYFVNMLNQQMEERERVVDPILIIDNNRTITGLKSTEIVKYLKFKNKLTKLHND